MSDQLFEYIESGGQHFHSFGDLPVVDASSTITAALSAAGGRGTQAVFVRFGNHEYRMATVDQIGVFQETHRAERHAVHAVLGEVIAETSLLPTVNSTTPLYEARRNFDLSMPRFRVKIVVSGGHAIGVLSEQEEFAKNFFQVPTLYQCQNGHTFAPPPPSTCVVDGTPVSGA